MKIVRKMPDMAELRSQLALTPEQQLRRQERIKEIEAVITGQDKRLLLLIGPCSADREDAVLDYMERLAKLQEKVQQQILIVPRVYTSKPRTSGGGYKGMLHRPQASAVVDNLAIGVAAVRKLHLHVIQESGFYCVDEMLYPELFLYWSDLLAYVAVGARSVEDQGHRLAASNFDLPVGMKNPMNGDVETLLNSIKAAQLPQTMVQQGMEVYSAGNPYAHAILRGYVDHGQHRPNYHYEALCRCYDKYQKAGLQNVAVIVDCNHSNSGKHADAQTRIAMEIMHNRQQEHAFSNFIKGLMIESYLQDGSQMVGGTAYGKSITDACIGWDKTECLICRLAEKV